MADREFFVVEFKGIAQFGHAQRDYADRTARDNFYDGTFSVVRYVPEDRIRALEAELAEMRKREGGDASD